MSRCIVAPSAKQDLKDINRYLLRFSSLAARKLKEKIKKQCNRLADFPEMGRRADDLQPHLRSFPVEDYLIFYRPIKNGVEIVRVVSGYRDLEALFSDE